MQSSFGICPFLISKNTVHNTCDNPLKQHYDETKIAGLLTRLYSTAVIRSWNRHIASSIMSEQPRKLLKITTSGMLQNTSETPTLAAPQSSISGTPKLKIISKARFTGSPAQDTASIASPKTTLKLKVPSKPKPEETPPSKKRDHGGIKDGGKVSGKSGVKKLRLSIVKKSAIAQTEEPQSATVTTPFVRFKVKEKFRKRAKLRQKGYAYDSEASDREDEPIQQWNFILRMPPGEDAEWVKQIIEKRQLEQNNKLFKLRFLQEDGRRAMLTVRNKTYAAILVDLPCIIESMKGWDKKGWYKSADIHQMLLVLGTVLSEDEALQYPLPKGELNEKTWAYAHGLTPPMHWVRKRRFRKRISTHAIQDIEESVRRLLEKDASASGDVQYEVLDREVLRRRENMAEEVYEDEESVGMFEGEFETNGFGEEVEEFQGNEEEELDVDAFEAQFESFLGVAEGSTEAQDSAEMQDTVQTPVSSNAAAFETQNATESDMGTPLAFGSKPTSDDDDDENDDDDESESESDKEETAGFERAREEISELESAIKEQLVEMERVGNPLLKTRIRNKIQALQADLELKKAAIGDEDDD